MTDRTNAGVRNLRAMFESQNASSPEPRGRSPAGSANGDSSARPTSTVRASFVSVVPPQTAPRDLGSTKGVSINSLQAHRRESFSVSDDTAPNELKKAISEEKNERGRTTSVTEAIPEQAVESRESSLAPPPIQSPPAAMPNLGSIMKGSDFPEDTESNVPLPKPTELVQPVAPAEDKPAAPLPTDAPGDNPDKVVTGVQEEVSLKPADPTSAAAVSGGEALPPPAENLAMSSTTPSAVETPKAAASTPKANGTSTTPGKALTKKPAAISTAKASTSKAIPARSPLPKSPGAARLPKTPTTPKPAPAASTSKSPAPAKAQAKPAAKAPAPRASRASLTAPTASAAAKVKAPATEAKKLATSKPAAPASSSKEGATTSPGGFKKPRPKSPTRPVRLPSHLTAPTASYAAKHGEEAAAQKVVRKPSTVTRPPPKAAAPAARKQPSRASLGPPTTAAAKRPESRASTQGGASEGFLARMMRPTASSASKTAEKPASPPRKSTATKAPAKPKGSESVVAKGKKKVEQVAEKVKDVVTNGHEEKPSEKNEDKVGLNGHDEEKPVPAETAEAQPEPAEPATDGGAVQEPARAATPVQNPDSSTVELQTPNFEGQTIR